MKSIAERMLPEFEVEMENTRRTLERVADDKLDFKPHPKSGSMLWLASHVANLPLWAQTACEADVLDVASFQMPKAENREQILANFEKHAKGALSALPKVKDEEMMKTWSLKRGDATLMSMPRIAVLRSMVMNHIIHHRAQLTVYLRMNDLPVPALYGPSADEAPAPKG